MMLSSSPRPTRRFRAFGFAGAVAALVGVACSSTPDAGSGKENAAAAASPLTSSSCQALDIATHYRTTYAVKPDGTVWGWGFNNDPYPLGYTALDPNYPAFGVAVTSPIAIPGVTNAKSVIATMNGGCAVVNDSGNGGNVMCWGQPLGTTQPANTPPPPPALVRVGGVNGPALSDVVGITGGDLHACAWTKEKGAWCWGEDYLGQLGDGAQGHVGSRVPYAVQMVGVSGVLQVAAAGSSTCVLSDTNDILCAGSNTVGQLGEGSGGATGPDGGPLPNATLTPITLPPGSGLKFATIYGGGGASTTTDARFHGVGGTFCATTTLVNNAQTTYCWGADNQGQVDVKDTNGANSPVQLSTSVGSSFAQGAGNACEVSSSGLVTCWGSNTYGQIPDAPATTSWVNAPTPVSAAPNAFKVVIGAEHVCALTTANIACWGKNDDGEIGNGTTGGRTGVFNVRLTVPSLVCKGMTGQIGATCETIANPSCGETLPCPECAAGNKCENNVCVDNPLDCYGPCASGTFCQAHRCVSSCGNNPLTDSSIGTTVAGGGGPRWSFSVSSPSGYGSSGCGQQWIVEVQNARYTGGHNVFVLPTTAVTDPTVCANTKLSIATYGDGNLVQSTQTTGVWMNSGLIHGCTFGFSNNGSNELTTPSGYNTVRIVVSGQQSSVSKGTTVWSTIPVTVSAGAIPT